MDPVTRQGAALPLVVYVVFHPDSKEAPGLARTVFRWLRLHPDVDGTGSMDGAATSAGLPVYYRAALARAGGGPTFTPGIVWEDARRTAIVPLVDDRIAVDADWRDALRALVKAADAREEALEGSVKVLPVMLDRAFDQLAFLARPHNPLRVYDRDDPAEGEGRTHARARRLRRRLTEELLRWMRQERPKEEPARLKVFLSHAKADGADVAERIRDGLAGVSQIEPWFDVNDLNAGVDATEPMSAAARASSGGVIAVRTDAYPTRPWCRHEATQAREPRKIDGGAGAAPTYVVQPTVAVDVPTGGWARPLAALAQVPRVGWPARPDPGMGDALEALRARERYAAGAAARIGEVVDRLLLEALLSAVAADRARSVSGARTEDGRRLVHLGFTPDVWTVQRLAAAGVHEGVPTELRYPGHALGTAERRELDDAVKVCFPAGSRLVADERVAIGVRSVTRDAGRLLVGVSIGGHDPDLYAAGVAREHLNDLLVRVARYVLGAGHRLAYGGKIAVQDSAMVALLDAAERWRADLAGVEVGASEEEAIAAADKALQAPPVINYVSADRPGDVTPELEARYLGVCEFRRLRYGRGRVLSGAERVPVALSEMRDRLAGDVDVQLLVGGKLHGWSGLLPGLAEELLAALTSPRRPAVLLVGGFGGCSRLLVDYLLGTGAVPDALTMAGEKAARKGAWPADERLEAACEARYAALHRELALFREEVRVAGATGSVRGVAGATWRGLCEAQSPTRVLRLLFDALNALDGAGAATGAPAAPR